MPDIATTNPGLQRIMLGAIGLPTGLMLTLMTDSPLYTGMTALIPAAVFEKKADIGGLLKTWTASFVGNLVGCALVLGLCSVAGMPPTPAPAKVAAAKTSLPFMQVLAKGVMCNTLVCFAILSFLSATSFEGKLLGVLLPISTFVALGLEHSIASAFMVPYGIMQGSAATFGSFMKYMVPATLGCVP